MWWNDIKEIRVTLDILADRVVHIDQKVEKLVGHVQENSEICLKHEEVEDLLIDLRDSFCPTDECSAINRIQDNLKTLIEDTDRKEDVRLAVKTLDKFEDYMKNVDKLNMMVNELKGCISIARASIEERKQVATNERETANLMIKIAEILRKQEKKSLKKRKSAKKKPTPSL